MAAPLGDENQQNAAVDAGEDFPEDQPQPIAGAEPGPSQYPSPLDFLFVRVDDTIYDPAVSREQAGTPALPAALVSRRPAPSVARLSRRARRLSRRLAAMLVQWFATRPLGQRALQAVEHTIATAEQAALWAEHTIDRRPVPFPWYLMVPAVTALMVVRTGAAVAERCLNVQLPGNSALVHYFQTQRFHLEQLQTAASANIRTQYVDENDTTHGFLNTWPLSILYRAAQELGVIAVRVHKEPSDAGSEPASVPSLEPVTSSTSSSSTPSDAEEHGAASITELTPAPETTGDRTSSPDDETETKEGSEEGAEQDNDRAEEEAEEVEEGEEKTEELPTITAEEAMEAAMAVVSPQPTAPPQQLVSGDEEMAAMGEVPKTQPQPTSEELLAAERASTSEPGASGKERKPTYKAPKTPFLNFLTSKFCNK